MRGAWRAVDGGLRLFARATPGADRDAIAGLIDDPRVGSRLAVETRARPEGGKANAAIARQIARTLAIAPSRVRLETGASAREKRFFVSGDGAALAAELARRYGAR